MALPKIEILLDGLESRGVRVNGQFLEGVRDVKMNAPMADIATVWVQFVAESITIVNWDSRTRAARETPAAE